MPTRHFRAARILALSAFMLSLVGIAPATAQEENPAPSADASAEPDLVLATMALDIATSDWYALVDWVRRLGLSDSGSAEELRSRLYAHFGIQPPAPAGESKKTITIVSADRTEYLNATDDGESTVHFTGRVSISVKDDDTGETLTIDADEVLVNRDANILSARGDIVFERKRANGTDWFMGESLELDMDDWSGVFLDGESRQGSSSGDAASSAAASASGATDTLFFRADDIVKRGADVLVFKDGVVSSCDDAHPHYSIRASKIWILGGNEWAMLNATLSVGEIPLLYLPFFYYPGEEIVFHPVIGYDARFGRYVQTTTYLLGEKAPKKQDISLLRLTDGTNAYERKVDGVFLRTTREKKQGQATDFVKVIVDLYSNLGGFAAVETKASAFGPFKSVTGFAGIGLTRSVFLSSDGSTYTPFVAAGDYASVWNPVDLFGLELPFRFGFDFGSSVDLGPLRMSFALPFYSDAYYNRDFKDRSEDMNWLQFLDQATDDTVIAKITSFTDSVSLSGSVPAASLPPWISSVSLGRFISSLAWSSVPKEKPLPISSNERIRFDFDPTNEFFVPYEWTLLDASVSLSGTLYRYPLRDPVSASALRARPPEGPAGEPGTAAEKVRDAIDAALGGLPALETPWAASEKPAAVTTDSLPGFSAPAIASPETQTDRTPLSASLSWSLGPTFTWKRRFLTSAWTGTEPSAVDWAALYETRTVRNAGTLSLSGALYDGLLGLSASLSASSQYQDRPRVIDNLTYASESLLATWARQDAQYRNDKVSATIKLSSSPFQDSWLWSPTSISYSLSSLLYEYAFESMDPFYLTDPSKASYGSAWADWTDDTVSAHALSLVLGLKPWGYAQTLTLVADLPPILEGYSGTVSLRSSWATLTVGTAYSVPQPGAEFAWDPLSASLTLGASPGPTLTSSFAWSIESSGPTSMTGSVAWKGLTASLSAREAIAYRLKNVTGWEAIGSVAVFRVNSAQLAFVNSWKPPPAWRRRIAWSIDVNASAQQSFLRFTDSYLNLVLGLTFKVHQFLDITFSSTSRNSSLWRYYPGLFDIPVPIEPVNPFVDLYKSFNFFDPSGADRRESLFKLKALSATATHYLHDWDLAMTFSALPVLDGAEYIFKPSFSVSLAWRSVSQIKSVYKRDGETVSWK
ncbi:MAG: hypothetical protein CVV51_02945 [Spirochaetae bacterium HGW-Spirochaetae-7]|nr:MAG: hypothetical protein CVV51_02945 [Spirochaetae bacterium HGW-Spirochaetae-7]